jgi:hypothetical protein
MVDMYDGTHRSRLSLLDSIFNFLTTLVLLTTIFLGGVFGAIYFNPNIFFNPFPPNERPIVTTPGITEAAPTGIPAVTVTPLVSPSPPPPTATLTPAIVSPEPTALPYSIQPGTPAYTQNFLNDLACEWAGVAGQVITSGDQSNPDPWVHLGGEFNGTPLDYLSLPGSAPGYGQGGYEFTLGNAPLTSDDRIWIQLEDPLGNAMTDRISITTSDLCSENLIIVNWVTVP